MANIFKREIEKNEVLVVRASLCKPDYMKAESRLFVARVGFGMLPFTMGRMVGGYDARFEDGKLVPEGDCRRDGYDFDVAETESWQAEHGRLAEEPPAYLSAESAAGA